jgi:hypothetical protein
MDWQLWLVMVLVGGASAYLGRSAWQTWRGAKGGCGKSCGCAKVTNAPPEPNERGTLIPVEQIKLRRRDPLAQKGLRKFLIFFRFRA